MMAIESYMARGKRKWKLDVWVTNPDGRQERVRERNYRTKALAEERERQIIADVYDNRFLSVTDRKITVDDAWQDYERQKIREKMKSLVTAQGRASQLLAYFGDRKAMSITLSDVEKYREHRLSSDNPPQVSTVNREVALLKAVLNLAVERGKLKWNPVARAKMDKENNDRRRTLSPAEFAKLYEAAEPELKDILLFAYDTGFRRGSILNLTWDKIDLSQDLGRVHLNPEDVKTGSGIPTAVLTSRVTKMLKERPRSLSNYVFFNPRTNTRWDNIKKTFRRACKKAGIPCGMKVKNGVIFHDLRRSFINNASKSVDSQIVMTMSGHKTRAAFERYRHVDDSDQVEAVKRLEAFYEEQDPKQNGECSDDSPVKVSGGGED